MDNKLFEQLLHENESSTLDFKRDQYPFTRATEEEKSELLKDILSFANAWRRTDAYILIGVQEVKGGKSNVVGTTQHFEEANLQQFVNSKTNKPINFSYEIFIFEEKQVNVIQIPVQERPIFLLRDFGKLSKDTVYVRRGSSTDTANPDEIAEMGAASIEAKQSPIINLQFGDKSTRTAIGSKLVLVSDVLRFPEKADIPRVGGSGFASLMERINPHFYREFADYLLCTHIFKPIYFIVSNNGEALAQNLRIKITQPKQDKLMILDSSNYLDKPQYSGFNFPNTIVNNSIFEKISADVEDLGDKWDILIKMGNIQPGSSAWSDIFYIGASISCEINLNAIIYADNLPKPIQVSLDLLIEAQERLVGLDELIDIANKSRKE